MTDWFMDYWHNSVELVIDGGAYIGAFVNAVRQRYPMAKVHAFEPCQKSCAVLERRYHNQPLVTINHEGLGESEYPWELKNLAGIYTNSFLRPAINCERYVNPSLMKVTGTELVWITSLDNYCREHNISKIDILKLDLQGYELRALQGAIHMLQYTRLIVCELFSVPIYEGQAERESVLALLAQAGFDLLYEQTNNGYWSDGLFIKRDNHEITNDHK